MSEESKITELHQDTTEPVNTPTEQKEPTNAEKIAHTPIVGGKKKISRAEFMEVMAQVSDNINQISHYLMEDMNMMYSRQVFPFQIRLAVLEDILIEKGLTTREEISERADKMFKELEEKAKSLEELKKEQESKKSDSEDSAQEEKSE